MKYLIYAKVPKGVFFKDSFLINKKIPNNIKRPPCPISPNITPNKKGKVIKLNKEGLISLYLGTP